MKIYYQSLFYLGASASAYFSHFCKYIVMITLAPTLVSFALLLITCVQCYYVCMHLLGFRD